MVWGLAGSELEIKEQPSKKLPKLEVGRGGKVLR